MALDIHFSNLSYNALNIKRKMEQILMFPFVLLGKCLSSLILKQYDLDQDYQAIFFFPGEGIGGAERTNSNIIECVSKYNKKALVVLTKKTYGNENSLLFKFPNINKIDISKFTDSKILYVFNFIYRGALSKFINKLEVDVLFVGQCNFGYKLLPHVSSLIKKVELIHMLDKQFANVWVPFISFIDTRILISRTIQNQMAEYYIKKGIPEDYLKRIRVIPNRLPFINETRLSSFQNPINVMYVGRGGPQKRLWILFEIANRMQNNTNVSFQLAGDIESELPIPLPSNIKYYGKIPFDQMKDFYNDKQILLMTSAWEGFPFAIMEAMSFGIIPIVTDVDTIPEYIQNNKNGFLLNGSDSEENIIIDAIEQIEKLANNPELFETISSNAFVSINQNFNSNNFCEEYLQVLFENNKN